MSLSTNRIPSTPRLSSNAQTVDYVQLLRQVDEEEKQKYTHKHSIKSSNTDNESAPSAQLSNRAIYKQTLSDVTTLGIQKLDKWTKAKVEEKRWIENGGQKHKNMNIPFNIKIGMIRKNKMRAERKRQRVSLFITFD